MTPLEFVQTYLVGQGVTVANATFNDLTDPLNSNTRPILIQDQIGSFGTTGVANNQLGLAGGVILSSGKVQNAIFGQNPRTNTGGGSDPDLVILATPPETPTPVVIHDKSILEFDFVPQTDVITFRYVFASVEFDGYCPSHTNPGYNDAFGLFLSGPGIAGGFGFINDAENIALLPSSTNYVNIANVCAVDQGNTTMNGVYSWWNSSTYFSYYRFTYVFTATRQVTCGETYHMKFAIGDAGDGTYDSGVFLEQNSFSSNDVSPTTTFSNPETGSLLVPGCSTSDLVYQLPQAKSTDVVVNLAIQVPPGTATQADILPNPFPLQVTIPAGELQSAPITIQSIPTAPGPDKTLVIGASTVTCSTTNSNTTSFTIKYNDLLSVNVPPQTICDGTSATLTPVITGGQAIVPTNTFHYLWSNSATTPTITVSPGNGHHTYSVTVTDACNQSVTKETYVDVGEVPSTAGTISGLASICPPVSNIVYSTDLITGADSYHWTLPAGATITSGNNTNSITVSFDNTAVSGNLTVHGSNDYCGDGPLSSSFPVTINPWPSAPGIISGPSTVCQGNTGKVFSVPPISNALSYTWTLPAGFNITGGNNTNSITVDIANTAVSGQVTVLGSNLLCGDGPSSVPYPVTILPRPLPAGPITGPASVCESSTGKAYSVAVIPNATTYLWTTPPGVVITSGNSTPAIMASFPTNSSSGNMTVSGQSDLCPDGVPSSLAITVNPMPGAATTVTGQDVVCQGYTGITYTAAVIPGATEYIWSYSGTGVSGQANTQNIIIDYSAGAISGNWKVFGRNACGDGALMATGFHVTVNPKPTAYFQVCTPLKTVKNGRKIQLKGGFPLPGVYSAIEGVSLNGGTGLYEFDPSAVTGFLPKDILVTFRFTNSQDCFDEKTQTINVSQVNADIISASDLKDLRDNTQYSYTTYSTGLSTRKWMTQNLNYGTRVDVAQPQADNCVAEKYCPPSDPACTGPGGGYYQWNELMEYQVGQGYQDICPPGWHVPSEAEWQDLIDNLDPLSPGTLGNSLNGAELKDPARSFKARLDGINFLSSGTWSFTSSVTVSMFWTSTVDVNGRAIARGLNNPYNPSISKYPSSPANAFPVRCVKD